MNLETSRQFPLPPEEVQRQTVSLSGEAALEAGCRIYECFKGLYEAHRGPLKGATVLDFGCGWGRVTRFFLEDVDPGRLWGVDHYDKMIELCQELPGNFRQNQAFPPIDFGDSTFDLIFCYSVFSHLSEDCAGQWVEEFSRILKPGGILIATTRKRDYIERDLGEVPYWEQGVDTLFRNTNAWLQHYDSGGFCFDTSRESYGEASGVLGEACIPERYVRERWPLRVLDFVAEPEVTEQNIIVAQRDESPA